MSIFFYTKCSLLPMRLFISVVVDGEYKALCKISFLKLLPAFIIAGKIKNIWESIFFEYLDLMKSTESAASLSLIQDVNFMWHKINVIEKTVESLRWRYNERLFTILRDMGYGFEFSRESYVKDLNRVITRTKGIVHQLALKNQQLQDQTTDEQIKESDYFDMCYAISKGVMSINKITVSEFCAAYNAYKREVELSNNRAKGVTNA